MKKALLVFLAVGTLVACNSGSKTDTNTTNSGPDITQNPDYQKGLAIEAKNNCKTCHNIDSKLTGPSFREIANKYADQPDTIVGHLANKIIAGGNGVWGEVPMLPHPELSKSDAESIVRYILLLKK